MEGKAGTEPTAPTSLGSPGLRAARAVQRLLLRMLARVRRAAVYISRVTFLTLKHFPREMGRVTLYLVCFSAFVGVTVELFGPWVALLLLMCGRPAWNQIRQRRGPAWWVWDQVRWNRGQAERP